MQRRLRYADLEALGIVRNRVTLRSWIINCGFPRGQMTGPNSRTWTEDEVQGWVDNRPIGKKPTPAIKRRPGRPRKSATTELTAT